MYSQQCLLGTCHHKQDIHGHMHKCTTTLLHATMCCEIAHAGATLSKACKAYNCRLSHTAGSKCRHKPPNSCSTQHRVISKLRPQLIVAGQHAQLLLHFEIQTHTFDTIQHHMALL